MQIHDTDRAQRAGRIGVLQVRPYVFSVLSQTDPRKEYLVGLTGPTCTCPDYQYRRHRCKHILAVEMIQAQAAQQKGLP